MKLVYASHDGLLVDYVTRALQSRGIRCVVRNQYLQGAAGELPPTECWPELWVLDNNDLALASEIVTALLTPDATREAWQCPCCGETLEAQFDQCWRCGSSGH